MQQSGMQQSVARWEDRKGSSRGAWLLQNLPGCLLVKRAEGWTLETVGPNSLSLTVMGEGPKRAWGSQWDHKAAIDFKLDNPEFKRAYPTRRELLSAVELILEIQGREPAGSLEKIFS